MSFAAGTSCGPYEILSLLGTGGMGEVYRARDPRLGRDVAIKVLPERVSSDAERLARFEQEARTTGSLNHPNILVIYDIGSLDGAPYIVSELLDGKAFRETLEAGAPRMRSVIDWARQIASGLAAAHERGIVHRDLKPENLFLCRDGRVKILDFGLAKLLEPRVLGADDATEQRPASTGAGMILGTVGYMAPEQVRGEPADARSDIFAFGAVLYEMCTGQRAFRRASAVETMHAVLSEEPPEFDRTARKIPPELERIVEHCLEKDRDRRFQSARDLADSLGAVGSDSTSSARLAAAAARRSWPARRQVVLAAGAVVVGTLLLWSAIHASSARAPDALPEFQRLTFRVGNIPSAAFAPDGQTVVYAAGWEGAPVQLYSTRIGGPESRPFGPARAGLFAVSRSGKLALSLGCRLNWGLCQGTLAEMSLSGGAPRELLEGVDYADWAPDEENLAVVRAVDGRYRLESPIGRVLFTTEGWITDVRFSPDGTQLAFCEHPQIGRPGGNVSVIGLQGERRVLSAGWKSVLGLTWSSDGREIWFNAVRDGNKHEIRAVDLSGKQRLVYNSASEIVINDIAPDGRALLTEVNATARMIGVRTGAGEEEVQSWFDWSTVADVSADGRAILFYEWGGATDGKPTVYLRPSGGGDAIRLDEGRPLALPPDGRWRLAVQGEPPQLVALPTGPGLKQVFQRSGVTEYYAARWFPDGRRVLFSGEGPDNISRTYVQSLDGGPAVEVAVSGVLGVLVAPEGGADRGLRKRWEAARLHVSRWRVRAGCGRGSRGPARAVER